MSPEYNRVSQGDTPSPPWGGGGSNCRAKRTGTIYASAAVLVQLFTYLSLHTNSVTNDIAQFNNFAFALVVVNLVFWHI